MKMVARHTAKMAPTLMCANLLELKTDMDALERAGADYFHIDVMDGHFVPNLAFSFDFIRSIRRVTSRPLDVHLMVTDPVNYLDGAFASGVNRLSFHLEASHTPIRLLREIRKKGMQAGLVLNPSVGVDRLDLLFEELDFVLVMGVEPGFSGQLFIPSTLEKISRLAEIRTERSLRFEIEVDGGISWENARRCMDAGADILIAGALCIFDGSSPIQAACDRFKKILREAAV